MGASPHLTSPQSHTTVLGRPIAITKERRGRPCRCIRQSSYTPERAAREMLKLGLLSGR